MSECKCNYSYTCDSCRAAYNAENALNYANELRDWTVESLQLLAKALKVELPEPPQKRSEW